VKLLGWSVARVTCSVCGIIAIIGVGWALVSGGMRRDRPARASPSALVGDSRLIEQLRSLERDVASLRQRQESFELSNAKRADALPDTELGPVAAHVEPSDENEDEPESLDPAQYQDRLEQVWEEQAVDTAWTERVGGELTTAFGEESLSGSSLLSAQCRGSLCRVEYAHEDEGSKQRSRAAIPHLAAFRSSSVFARPADDRRLQYVLFMTREGERLPELVDK
jgi:hypothetical protein